MKVLEEVVHFSHNDLDGIGCITMAKNIFQFTLHHICGYDNIDNKIKEFLSKYVDEDGNPTDEVFPFERILITDISVQPDTAEMLDYFCSRTGVTLNLIDHHETASWLNEYEWASVFSTCFGTKTSGTSEMMRLLVNPNPVLTPSEKGDLGKFAEVVRLYDTWDWNKLGIQHPKMLSDLMWIIGHDDFIERFTNDLDPVLSTNERYLVDTEAKREQRFIEHKEKQMFKTIVNDGATVYNVGVVYAEQHHSILGNTLCKNNPDIDFVVIVNMGAGKVSYRTVKDHIHVGEISKRLFGGGGHRSASGSEFPTLITHHFYEDNLRIDWKKSVGEQLEVLKEN